MNAIARTPPYCGDSKLETFQNLLDLQNVNAWFLRVIGPAAWSSTGTKRLERAVAPGRDEGRTGDGGTGMNGPFGIGRAILLEMVEKPLKQTCATEVSFMCSKPKGFNFQSAWIFGDNSPPGLWVWATNMSIKSILWIAWSLLHLSEVS